ncbi:metallophosphoesterase family protein [Martelella endophytica]|uniref:Serine/threonine protein phosphatase n=1 Tax=Martelella endophytica TaxID=1486262 RepID=A0A0D5LSB5_MAREN|nr:DNA repair exonuclease [Martelella endophytica]AJY46667.1 serine/threonine protein phosphatase [Martelella endophytica]
MSSFRFIHAADLHLGSPLSGLRLKDKRIAERFAAAGRDAFTALIDRALSLEVDFLVIAGDVYDGAWKDNHIGLFFNREIARLARAGIPVYFLRGNHDAESIVTRTIAMPDDVHEFSTRKPETFVIDHLKVALHGQGFAERVANDNLALAYPPAVPGHFNIGVLHTSLSGRPPHAVYAPCTPADLASRGYDYWALGHVHSFEEVSADPLTIFPGNLQGRNIRETGEKGAVLVTVEEGRARYERLSLDCARFEAVTVTVTPDMQDGDILSAVEHRVEEFAEAADERPLALRLSLSGRHDGSARLQSARGEWHDDLQAALQRVHAELWLEKLVLDLLPPDDAPRPVQDETTLDIERMIDAIAGEPEIGEALDALIEEIAKKLPGGAAAEAEPLGDSASALLAEARAILGARLSAEN